MKFAIALNRKADLVAQTNALGHICIGLPSMIHTDSLRLREFADMTGQFAARMTDHPLIIFTARSSEHLRTAHLQAIQSGVVCNAFFNCMRSSDPEYQEASIRRTVLGAQQYVAVGFFGKPDELKPITRQFSLYRNPNSEPDRLTSVDTQGAQNEREKASSAPRSER